MAKPSLKRNVGLEILEGLRELKRGEIGRVVNIPPVAVIREGTGLSQAKFAVLLGFPYARYRNGNKVAVLPLGRLARC